MNKRQILDDSKELFSYLADSQIRKNWIENDIINSNYYYNKQFYFNDSQIIRCCFCGYRILYKIRTQNYITYVSD